MTHRNHIEIVPEKKISGCFVHIECLGKEKKGTKSV